MPVPFVVNVCACGSSGSTLFARILDQHPEIACGEELFLFCAALPYEDYETFRRWVPVVAVSGLSGNPFHQGRAWLRNARTYGLSRVQLWRWAMQERSFRDFVARIRSHVLERTGKPLWAEKTPRNARLVSRFIEHFPDGRIIHIVRDPRDVIASLAGRRKQVLPAAETWLGSVGAMQPYREHPNVLEVRYEDLCTNPEATMRQVWTWLSVDARPEYLYSRDHASAGLKHLNVHSSWGQRPGGGLSTASIGRHRSSGVDFAALGRVRLTRVYADVLGCTPSTLAEYAASYGYEMDDREGWVGEACEPFESRWRLSPFRRWVDARLGVGGWVPMIEVTQELPGVDHGA